MEKRIVLLIFFFWTGCIYSPDYEGALCESICPPGFLCVDGLCMKEREPTITDGDSGVPDGGDETVSDGDEIISDGDEVSDGGDEVIADGDETVSDDGDETVSDGDEAVSDGGDEVVADGDEGSEADETPDDCSLPEPESPLYLFFCLENTQATNLALWRLFSVNELEWTTEPNCTASDHRLTCRLTDYGSGTSVYFDIAVDDRWACTLGTGLLKVWHQGNELSVETVEPQIANENGLTNGYYIAGYHWLFQTFTTGASVSEIKSVSMHIVDKVGSPKELVVSIRATDNGLPSGPDLVSETVAEVFVNRGWNTFTFDEFLNLPPYTQYAIVVRAPSGSYPSHFYSWDRSNSNAYSGGRAGEIDGAGNASFLDPNIDYLFRVTQGCNYKITLP